MLFLHFCKALFQILQSSFSDSAKPSFYIPCKSLIFTYYAKLIFTYCAKTYFYIPCKNLFLHTMQKLNFTYCAKTLFLHTLQYLFLLFCKPHFTYSAIPSFYIPCNNSFFTYPVKTSSQAFDYWCSTAEIYPSCKYGRQSHFAQYVNIRIWPKLSAVHHNPIWVELRRMPIQTNYR